MELKRIGVLSLAKITTLFGVIGGILIAIIFGILKALLISKVPEELFAANPQIAMISQFTFPFALILIVQYAVIGFIWGLLVALIYNLVAKYVGGVKLEFAEAKKK